MKIRSTNNVRGAILPLFLFFACLTLHAQTPVSGVISDSNGEPLAGVSIIIKGTTVGVTSDLLGNYSIKAPGNSILEISFIGMLSQEVPVNNRAVINVTMEEDVANLEESVVIGYGVRKRAHLTGSVATVSQKDMLKTTASNISQTLHRWDQPD